jgi:hypothetical protein
MINFFRKIRKKLADDNKLLKYAGYAIGEIVLVMIGILLALQVNNWKEAKKDLKEEITILKNIKKDVIADTLDVTFNIKYHKVFLESEKKLNAYIHGNENIMESQIDFINSLGSPLFSILHQASFTNLQNNDLGIITNNELKQEISRHYDFFVRVILTLENEMREYEAYPSKLPYYLKYFNTDDSISILSNEELNSNNYYNPNFERTALKLIDSKGLKNDNAFKIVLTESIFFRQTKIQFYEDFLNRTKNIIQKIDNELNLLAGK